MTFSRFVTSYNVRNKERMENDTTNTYMERMKLNKNSELKAANKAQRKKKTEERRNKRRKNIFGRGGGGIALRSQCVRTAQGNVWTKHRNRNN